ncbi:hypothetical protein [Kribbella shirazensis]|uniref:Uncharacterized protein n=1 Tax=Kribbella shirazensis TaxID=1105143 RepID=A0A7X5V6P4_9ACTN|nr:hypothetical protein [Kribbella shirazensis]NIK55201.1 hypothetical protein [Kribbella shirazensis]
MGMRVVVVVGAGVVLVGSLVTGAAADEREVTSRAEQVVPLDVTGDAELSVERDRLAGLLKPLAAYDGAMLWSASAKTLTVQMTTAAALEHARSIIGKSATGMHVRFVQVEYSAMELQALADRLLQNQHRWAGRQVSAAASTPPSTAFCCRSIPTTSTPPH